MKQRLQFHAILMAGAIGFGAGQRVGNEDGGFVCPFVLGWVVQVKSGVSGVWKAVVVGAVGGVGGGGGTKRGFGTGVIFGQTVDLVPA